MIQRSEDEELVLGRESKMAMALSGMKGTIKPGLARLSSPAQESRPHIPTNSRERWRPALVTTADTENVLCPVFGGHGTWPARSATLTDHPHSSSASPLSTHINATLSLVLYSHHDRKCLLDLTRWQCPANLLNYLISNSKGPGDELASSIRHPASTSSTDRPSVGNRLLTYADDELTPVSDASQPQQ